MVPGANRPRPRHDAAPAPLTTSEALAAARPAVGYGPGGVAIRGAVALLLSAALHRCIPVNTAPEPQYAQQYQAPPRLAPVRPLVRPFCEQFPPAASGRSVQCEDFSTVADGTLPAYWQGGEGLVVRGPARQRVLTPFEAREVHRVLLPEYRARGDYQLDILLQIGRQPQAGYGARRYAFHVGAVTVRLETEYRLPNRLFMNQSQTGDLRDLTGQAVRLTLRREGAVHRLLLNGQEALLARYAAADPVDGLSFEFENFAAFSVAGVRFEGAAATLPTPVHAAVAPPAQVPTPASTATATPPAPAAEPRALAFSDDGVCAHMSDLSVRCRTWDGAVSPLEREFAALVPVAGLASRDGALCATDGQGLYRCWGSLPMGTRATGAPPPFVLQGRGGQLVPPAVGMNSDGAMPLVVSPEGEVRATEPLGATSLVVAPLPFSGPVAQADQGAWTACARLRDGTVECTPTGYGAPSRRPVAAAPRPVPVAGVVGATDIRLGREYGCALLADGQVRCWGLCTHAEAMDGEGAGTPACRATERPRGRSRLPSFPVRLAAPARSITESCAVLNDGSVQCWTADVRGRPGLPQAAAGLDHARAVASTGSYRPTVCAVRDGGAVQCWTDGDPQAPRRNLTF